MTETPLRDDVQTHVVTDALRRFGLRIVLAVVVVGIAVGGYAHLRPSKYTSTTTVLVRPLSGNALSSQTSTSSQSTTVAMETEASLVTSSAVTQRANEALGTSLASSGGNVTATVPTNSQIVRITDVARTARGAQQRAQAYANAFLQYRSDLATQSQKALLDRLNAHVGVLTTQLQQALRDAALKKNKPVDADTRVRLLTANLGSLQTQIGGVAAAATDPGNVVIPAGLPTSPTGLSPALLTFGGTFGALIVAVAIAIWRERTDDRIRARTETTLLGLPVLAVLRDDAVARSGKRPVGEPARSEALRKARTSFLAVTDPNSVTALAGLSERERAVNTAMDLARSVAAAGYRVALVDAGGPHEPRPDWLLDGDGLSEALGEPGDAPLPLRTIDGVQVLGPGRRPGAAAERYDGHGVRTLLRRLQKDADYVLVAAAPAETPEGIAMLLAVDAAVLIATDRVTTHDELALTTNGAQRLGATMLGLFVEQADPRRHPARTSRAERKKAAEPAKKTEKTEKPRPGEKRAGESPRVGAPKTTSGAKSGAVAAGTRRPRWRQRGKSARAPYEGSGSRTD